MPKSEEMQMLMAISNAVGKLDGQIEGVKESIEKNYDEIGKLYTKVNTLEKREVRISTKMMVVWGIIVIIAGKVLGIKLFSMFGG